VQKLKVDTEAAMLSMDQILKANELNVALLAAIPAFIVAGGTLVLAWRWLTPTPPDPKYEALPCRLGRVGGPRGAPVSMLRARFGCSDVRATGRLRVV
jgi:nuclear control of ATPase protein 2